MDISSMIEKQKQREQLALEERLKAKMRRQIRIFNKEKSDYTKRTKYEISKQRRSLTVLERERDVELDNYIATQSVAIEKRYKQEEGVVRDLVETTDDIRHLLKKDIEESRRLEIEVDGLVNDTWHLKDIHTKQSIENSKFRLPDNLKMEGRIEWASGKYHMQLNENRVLQDKIDRAIYVRDKFMKEENRLQKRLEALNQTVTKIMNETAEIYEMRDRAEGTKLKVTEHLSKVKDQYERELLNINLAINDDKKMDNFMRTKHKDITQYLHKQRELEMDKVKAMISKKDEFTVAFDNIKEATGKSDLNEIVHDFIEQEEDNFRTFLTIGEVLDENERLRENIRDLRISNVKMEDKKLQCSSDTEANYKTVQASVDAFKQKSENCQKRLADNSKMIDELIGHIQNIIRILNVDRTALANVTGKEEIIKDRNLIQVMAVVEEAVAEDMSDYYMLELSTRAVIRGKEDATPDQLMMSRIPSFTVQPHSAPKITPHSLVKEKDDIEEIKNMDLLRHDDVRDIVVQSMLDKPAMPQKKSTQSRAAPKIRNAKRSGPK